MADLKLVVHNSSMDGTCPAWADLLVWVSMVAYHADVDLPAPHGLSGISSFPRNNTSNSAHSDLSRQATDEVAASLRVGSTCPFRAAVLSSKEHWPNGKRGRSCHTDR